MDSSPKSVLNSSGHSTQVQTVASLSQSYRSLCQPLRLPANGLSSLLTTPFSAKHPPSLLTIPLSAHCSLCARGPQSYRPLCPPSPFLPLYCFRGAFFVPRPPRSCTVSYKRDKFRRLLMKSCCKWDFDPFYPHFIENAS